MSYYTVALEPLPLAVEIDQLADFMAVDLNDGVLPIIATLATSIVVEFLQCELVARNRSVTYQQWPFFDAAGRSLSNSPLSPEIFAGLPFANLLTVANVTAHGELTTDYVVVHSRPASLRLPLNYSTSDTNAPLVINYRAGFGESISDVPIQIQYGIMQLAAFLYENRGSCDSTDALKKSGAFGTLYPHKFSAVQL